MKFGPKKTSRSDIGNTTGRCRWALLLLLLFIDHHRYYYRSNGGGWPTRHLDVRRPTEWHAVGRHDARENEIPKWTRQNDKALRRWPVVGEGRANVFQNNRQNAWLGNRPGAAAADDLWRRRRRRRLRGNKNGCGASKTTHAVRAAASAQSIGGRARTGYDGKSCCPRKIGRFSRNQTFGCSRQRRRQSGDDDDDINNNNRNNNNINNSFGGN